MYKNSPNSSKLLRPTGKQQQWIDLIHLNEAIRYSERTIYITKIINDDYIYTNQEVKDTAVL